MKGEIWKDVVGFEGKYQISDKGNVRSSTQLDKEWKVLKLYVNKQGYHHIKFYVSDYKSKSFRINRLVATAFIPNPENKPWVNHINGVKDDNRVENLEWCTIAENVQHSFDELGRIGGATGRFGSLTANHRRVVQMDWDYNKIKSYDAISVASRETGVPIQTIHRSCNKGNDNATKYNKYRWKYEQ